MFRGLGQDASPSVGKATRRRRATTRPSRTTTDSPGCHVYTSDAADDLLRVDLGGRRIIKKKSEAADDRLCVHLGSRLLLKTKSDTR